MLPIAPSQPESWIPSNEEEREAVHRQLEKVLRHPLFAHSQRYPMLLRYVVEQAVAGTVAHIKERTIGVLVFGRNPAYDANADPVVRVTAGQIRKRLVQYYAEPEHRDEIRIVLPIGSYVPQLLLPGSELDAADNALVETNRESVEAEAADAVPHALLASVPVRRWLRRSILGVALLLLTLSVTLLLLSSRDDVHAFWLPLLDAHTPILLSMRPQPSAASTNAESEAQPGFSEQDLRLALRLSAADPELGKRLHVQSEAAANFESFRSGPVIFLASGPDAWASRLGAPLRFALVQQGDGVGLLDRQNPAAVRWSDPHAGHEADGEQAYAVVARFFDPALAQPVVLVAGTSPAGLAAGVELITNERGMAVLRNQAPSGWQKKNLEVVVAADVVNRYGSAPRVLATRFW